MTIFTIGFSKKSLREFIKRLQKHNINQVIDIRLNNTSQLAGFAKKEDLKYILELVGIEYKHMPEFAPTDAILKGYKNKKITWDEYEKLFIDLLKTREPLPNIVDTPGENICLLCSEDKPKECHRRLVAEYFLSKNYCSSIKHL
ncbi:uncharacterized protein (DUF488 family) [Desulfohalotomaculum tongense]|uniref:DUF488 domain-containing protein n=1 Tax=Desulforadius tongensis TaxID=1216062 RepID=UPI001955F916|nr:DUF488 domain-containing protein [Desulforadius tongensis]MBM7853902.1 uncharacterized protein (DUF488 family) [Desulforadius tongensis]